MDFAFCFEQVRRLCWVLSRHDLTYILKGKSVCCVENRKNGVKVEAGRHLEGHYSNLKDNNSLNQAGFRKRGEKCLDSVYVLEESQNHRPNLLL